MPYRDNNVSYKVFVFSIPYQLDTYDEEGNETGKEIYWNDYFEEMINKKAAEGYKLVSHSKCSGMTVFNPLDPSTSPYRDKFYGYIISCVFEI